MYEHEQCEQILEDSRNAITIEDVQGILKFQTSVYAEQCLKKAEHQRLSLSEFIAVRDYLIVRLGLENAQRPGPMESARLRDFAAAEDDRPGCMVMYVARHERWPSTPGYETFFAQDGESVCRQSYAFGSSQ